MVKSSEEKTKNKTDEIIAMLTTNKNNLNIFHNERRLILLAIIKSNYHLPTAFKINAPSYMEYSGYTKKFYRYDINMRQLKEAVAKIEWEAEKKKKTSQK